MRQPRGGDTTERLPAGMLDAKAQPLNLDVEVPAVEVLAPDHPPTLDRAAAVALARMIRHARVAVRQDGTATGGNR